MAPEVRCDTAKPPAPAPENATGRDRSDRAHVRLNIQVPMGPVQSREQNGKAHGAAARGKLVIA
jgi:hypothetical protein